MTDAEIYFNELAKEIPDAQIGKMFGSLCFKMPNGKAAAMFWKDNIVVKLNEDVLKEAMNLNGSKLFEPMEGRPMKEWIQIPFEYKDKWKEFAMISAEGVQELKKKVTSKKK